MAGAGHPWHEAARVRVLLGLACRELGDAEGAELEFEAARATFEGLRCRRRTWRGWTG